MQDEIQNAVRRTVWPWDAPPAKPADARAAHRRKALVQGLVMAVVAVVLVHSTSLRVLPAVLAGLSVLNALLGLFAPAGFAAVDRALARFGHLAGQGVTWLLLAPFYYLVFVPARVALALRGKDPMHRAFPSKEQTYWLPRRPAQGPDDYRKQF